jgi:hypothetical protein
VEELMDERADSLQRWLRNQSKGESTGESLLEENY